MTDDNIPQLDPQAQESPEPVDRLSWTSILGALTGLSAGVTVAMLTAAALDVWLPGTRVAAIFWDIASPLLGILGLIVGSMAFHRWLPDRPGLQLTVMLAVVILGLYLAFGPVGFPWWA